MKTNFLKFGSLILLFTGLFLTTSCEKEVLSDGISADNALKSAQIDVAMEEVDGIVEEAYVTQEGIMGRSAYEADAFLPPCMTRTVVISGLMRTVTLDFGTSCTMPNGNVLSGIITIVYEHNPSAQSRTITLTYNNFKFNNILFAGGGSIVRVLQNANGNPQSTATVNVTATFPNGNAVNRTGTKIREWVAGFGNGIWSDNVFLVTGNWTTSFSNGDVNSGVVTTPLRREMACRFFVSGVIVLSHNNVSGTFDFGDGTCDNQATFTGPNGVVHNITLGQ